MEYYIHFISPRKIPFNLYKYCPTCMSSPSSLIHRSYCSIMSRASKAMCFASSCNWAYPTRVIFLSDCKPMHSRSASLPIPLSSNALNSALQATSRKPTSVPTTEIALNPLVSNCFPPSIVRSLWTILGSTPAVSWSAAMPRAYTVGWEREHILLDESESLH